MIEEDRQNRWKEGDIERSGTSLKDALQVGDYEIGSYIKVMTGIPNFSPIYTVSRIPALLRYSSFENKNSKKMASSQNRQDSQKILKFGSQLYLKVTLPLDTKGLNLGYRGSHQLHVLKPFTFSGKQETIYCEILIKNSYLTKVNQSVELRSESSSEAIWVIEELQKGHVRICSIQGSSYLELNNKKQSAEFHLVPSPSFNSIFSVQAVDENYNQYRLVPRNQATNARTKSNQIHRNSQATNAEGSGIEVQMLPVNSSLSNICYELTFASWAMENNPSLKLIRLIIEQMLFYSIPDFIESEGLISQHIQAHFYEMGLSKTFANYLLRLVSRSDYLQKGEEDELHLTVSKHIRLLCLNSEANSQLFWPLIPEMLDAPNFNSHLRCISEFIKNNRYFALAFQRKELYQVMMAKISFSYTTRNYSDVSELYQLVAEFCKGPESTPNKYLIMHTIQREEAQKSDNLRDGSSSLPWLRLFAEGIFIFSESLNRDDEKYEEIELQTYLNQSEEAEHIFIGQLSLLSAFCHGYNINAINKFAMLFSSIIPYCYKENFPVFENPVCLNTTLSSIITAFDWLISPASLSNKYLFGLIYPESVPKPAPVRPQLLKSRGAKPSMITDSKGRSNYAQLENNSTAILEQINGLFKYFENCLSSMVGDVEGNPDSLANYIRGRNEFSGRLMHWLKIVNLVLDARLLTILRKKEAPYLQYLKKMFENNNFRRSRSKTPHKDRLNKSLNRASSVKRVYLAPDNEYQPSINVILEAIHLIFKLNPSYQLYLKVMRAVRDGGGKSNKDKLMEKMFRVKNEHHNYFEESNREEGQVGEKNSIIEHTFRAQGGHEELQISQDLTELKSISFQILSLIHQKFIEEELELSVQTLAYLVKNPNHLTNKFDLNSGLKKLPYTDPNARLVLLENWYLACEPSLLNHATTVLRYIYDQAEIYIRSISMVMVVCEQATLDFHQGVSTHLSQLQKLSEGISTWFRPQVLFYQPAYEQNYHLTIRYMQSVNSFLAKVVIPDQIVLQDFQRILDNLQILKITSDICQWLVGYEGRKISPVVQDAVRCTLQELSKILFFYIYNNEENKRRLLILVGEQMTASKALFPLFLNILKSSKKSTHNHNVHELISSKMHANIVKLLPFSKDYFEIILDLNEFLFVKALYGLAECIHESCGTAEDDFQFEGRLLEDDQCSELMCKVVYRALEISNCLSDLISWFYNRFLRAFLTRETKANVHFKSKVVYTINTLSLDLYGSIAYLLNFLYTKVNLGQSRPKRALKQGQQSEFWLQTPDGHFLVTDYICNQLLCKFLQKSPGLLKKYIEYYLFDLLPLLRHEKQILEYEQLKLNVNAKIEQFLQIYEELQEGQTERLQSSSIKPVKLKKLASMNLDSESKPSSRKAKKPSPYDSIFDLDNLDRAKIQKVLQGYVSTNRFEEQFQPRTGTLLFQNKFKFEEAYNPTFAESPTKKSAKVEKNVEGDELQDAKVSKKALKKWFRARHELNESRPSLLVSQQKFLTDISSLENQFSSESGEQVKNKVINGMDIISKMVQTVCNLNRLRMAKENQIFVCKFLLLWVRKVLEEEGKSKRRDKEKKKGQTISRSEVYLIKNYRLDDVVCDVLDQILFAYKNRTLNVICICSLLFLITKLFELDPSSVAATLLFESEKLMEVLNYVRDNYHSERELIHQMETSNSLDYLEPFDDQRYRWSSLGLTLELIGKVVSHSSASQMDFQLICVSVLKAKINLGKQIKAEDLERVDSTLEMFEKYDSALFERLETELRYYNEYYSTLTSIK